MQCVVGLVVDAGPRPIASPAFRLVRRTPAADGRRWSGPTSAVGPLRFEDTFFACTGRWGRRQAQILAALRVLDRHMPCEAQPHIPPEEETPNALVFVGVAAALGGAVILL